MTRAATDAAFETEETSPTSMRLVGRLRPPWALLLGRLLAIPTLGASLLLLRIRRTCVGTASVADGVWGPQLRLSGQLPESLPLHVAQLLTSDGDAPNATGEGQADINATIARRRRIDLTRAAPLLNFDSGLSLTVRDHALIGRAPTAASDDPAAMLLPIDDPGLSMSKTHLAVGVDTRGFWICDLHSTNGSAITDVDGVKVPCVAGKRHYVAAGSTVHMGDRSFAVVLSGLSIGQSH